MGLQVFAPMFPSRPTSVPSLQSSITIIISTTKSPLLSKSTSTFQKWNDSTTLIWIWTWLNQQRWHSPSNHPHPPSQEATSVVRWKAWRAKVVWKSPSYDGVPSSVASGWWDTVGCSGIIKLPLSGECPQCKCMVGLRDFPLIVPCLGW